MNKKEYLGAMHKIYRHIYSQYGDKDRYTLQEGSSIIVSFLVEFPKAFVVNEVTFKCATPAILNRSLALLKAGMSIDEILLLISIVALKEAKIVSRLFDFKILLWSLNGSLSLAPE